jgi:hypothetical protein
MEKYFLIAFGASIGAVLSLVATEISARRRLKEDREKNRKTIRDEMISDCLKYVFKANDIINEIKTNMDSISLVRSIHPDKVGEIQKQLYGTIDSKMKEGLFVELMQVTFHVKRIGDVELNRKFEELIEIQKKVMDSLLFPTGEIKFNEIDDMYKVIFQEFVEYCINKCKI